jgi:hypothetical protein
VIQAASWQTNEKQKKKKEKRASEPTPSAAPAAPAEVVTANEALLAMEKEREEARRRANMAQEASLSAPLPVGRCCLNRGLADAVMHCLKDPSTAKVRGVQQLHEVLGLLHGLKRSCCDSHCSKGIVVAGICRCSCNMSSSSSCYPLSHSINAIGPAPLRSGRRAAICVMCLACRGACVVPAAAPHSSHSCCALLLPATHSVRGCILLSDCKHTANIMQVWPSERRVQMRCSAGCVMT